MFGLMRCCNLRVQSTLTKVIYRQFMKVPDNVALMLKRTDHVPKNFTLVYRETSYAGAGVMYHFLNFFTCMTIGTGGYMWYKNEALFDPDAETPLITRPWHGVVLVLSLANFYLLAWITRRRYPVRVYYNDEDKMYKAIFVGRLPYTIEQYDFPQNSLSYVAKDSILFWRNSLYNHENRRKMLLFEDKFRTPNDLYQMLKPHELDK